MSTSGSVKFFNTRKGYGFVTHGETQTDYFVHTSDVVGQALKEGDAVTFEIGAGNDGREKAVNVQGGTGGDPRQQQQRGGYGSGSGGYGGQGQGNRGGFGGGFGQGQGGSYGGQGQGGSYGGQSGGYGGNQGGYGGNSGGFGGRSGGFDGGDGAEGGKKVCYNFRDNGECRFGDQCRFLHERN